MKHNFETLAHLKNFVNSLSEDELKQPVRFWGEEVGGTIAAAEMLNDDYINPSGECCEPRAAHLAGGEFYEADSQMEDEPIVLHKGSVVFEVDRGGYERNNLNFEKVVDRFQEFSLRVFEKSTAATSLIHLERELEEAKKEIIGVAHDHVDRQKLLKEYADIILCVISSAARVGFNGFTILNALAHKTTVNIKRKWNYNGDGTYSHVKENQ